MNEDKLCEEAITLPLKERTAFLDKACAGRPDLRASVEAMITARQNTSTLEFNPSSVNLDQTVNGEGRGTDGTPVPDDSVTFHLKEDYPQPIEATTVIAGRYTLLELIGEGGMGEVWVAQQTEPVKRKVALKLIKAGMDTKSVVQRFEQERQALAMMDHPNIAKVLDGGLTQARRPFFVMELVNGLPLTNYCDQQKMGIRDRLQLFTSICQAVQHAHQKGIIHRDLKPSNILVTTLDGKAVPKVIDFGIAKAVSSPDADVNQFVFTQVGSVIGTLEYMAPEQAEFSGEDIDTRADIYSLGVILYELLTGVRPLDTKRTKKAAITEVIRILNEEEPSKPSSRVSHDAAGASIATLRQIELGKLQSLLKGELDWVVMKCLEKQRDRRYQTANALSRDIQRYLADEVVEARPPSTAYRLRKLARRYRGQFIAASMVLLALIAGIIGTTWGLIRLGYANKELELKNNQLVEANNKSETRFNLARKAIEAFHTGVSEDFLLKEEKFKNLRERFLTSASDFYEKLGALLKDDAELPSRRALLQANFDMADLALKVGRKESALQMHKHVLDEREKLRELDSDLAQDVAQSLLAVGGILEETGKNDEALAAYANARAVVAASDGSPPEDSIARATFAEAESRTGWLQSIRTQPTEGRLALERARDLQEGLAAADETNNDRQTALANTHHSLGKVLSQIKLPSEAEEEYRKALAIRKKLALANPNKYEYWNQLANTHNNLATLLKSARKTKQADDEYREALTIRKRLVDNNLAVTDFAHLLAGNHRNYANMLADAENSSFAETKAEYCKGIAIERKLVEENPLVSRFRYELAGGQEALGNLYARVGKANDAITEYRDALGNQEILVKSNPDVPEYRNRRGYIHFALGNLFSDANKNKEAEVECREALKDHRKLVEENSNVTDFQASLVSDLSLLSDLLRKDHRFPEAITSYKEALDVAEPLANQNPNNQFYKALVADLLRCRGLAYLGLNDRGHAADDTRRSLETWERLPKRNGDEWFGTACCHSVLSALAGKSDSGIPAADGPIEAAKAMDLLVKKAAAMGFRNPDVYRNEPALETLRNRDDFKKLMVALDPKTKEK